MELELQGWKVKAALVAFALVVVAAPLVRAVEANKGRAEDWHRRAVVAEESVSGLRVVIEERSRALNKRTVQANQLANAAQSNGDALRQTKVSVGKLTRRQQSLASENSRLAKQRTQLQTRLAKLEAIATTLGVCATRPASPTAGAATTAAARADRAARAKARNASCARASANLDAYREQYP